MATDHYPVELTVDGQIHGGWTSAHINRSLLALSGSFNLTLTEKWPGNLTGKPIKPGSRCRLSLDGETVIEGHIDEAVVRYDGENHQVSVSGRDLTGDLPDCSVLPEKAGEIKGLSLKGLAGAFCQPYGIGVTEAQIPDQAKQAFITFRVEPGETVFEALERASRMRGVLLTVDSQGRLLITSPDTGPARYRLALGREILTAELTASHRDRYSLYRVEGLADAGGQAGDNLSAQGLAVTGEITDPAITRYRPRLLQAEDSLDPQAADNRAKWQAARAMASGNRAAITVQGWRASDGKLWRTNTPVALEDGFLGYSESKPLLIVNVAFSLDEGGTRTELELMPAAGLTPEPLSETDMEGLY
ncbi:contractile injection system protein, VgrG/Pvc8 family [Kistimonas scapharcae]|uniref:Contractile injection system protein, VgrG/Pvc8 family n=1 Tax=Kistimonas scapharcae TaxID=1036133 RepID=A0ABP8V6M5_9GAMM